MSDRRSAEAAAYRRLYKTARWTKLRASVLDVEPLCRRCHCRGLVRRAEIADHVMPHQGDVALFYDADNLQPLCKPCHDIAKQREEVALGYHGAYQYKPEWLEPSAVPLTIVCGPPASGKSTYVAERASPGDIVIDLDVIASELSGQSLHAWDRGTWLGPAIRQRNHMLGQLSKRPQCDRAWLILSEASPDGRQWWADKMKPASIVVLEVPASVCVDRVRSDPERDRNRTFDAIGRWWSAYARRDGDVVVKNA